MPNHKPKKKILATYDYRDESGQLLFQKVRFDPKGFAQRRPNGKGGWLWNLKEVKPVLYRLPELLAADPSQPVFICEGEKDADFLVALGFVATTNPEGAKARKRGNWRPVYNEYLRGRQVVLPPDNDDSGRVRVEVIAESVFGVASRIKIVALPGLQEKGDISDWLERGGTKEELLALVNETPDWQPTDGDNVAATEEKTTRDENSMRSQMVAIGRQVELFRAPDSDGDVYGTIRISDHGETYALNRKPFRRWLAGQLWQREGRAATSGAIDEAITVLSAIARFEGPANPVAVRVAEHEGVYYLDLSDDEWRAVQISKSGWLIISNPPVKFIRPRGVCPLAHPVKGGAIEDLWRFVNVASKADRALVVSWLVAALRPSGPFPILAVYGEQGSAKSTTCRVLRALVDPNVAPLRAEPRDERDLVIAARNAWLLGFDNLSSIKPALSDALCRLSTGGGFSTRELYSDGDEILFQSMRPVLLNGITEIVSRPDLLDRAITLRLAPIAPGERRTEKSLWAEFDQARPGILGALLDAVVEGLRNFENVTLSALPRMADFAQFAVAAEPAFGLPSGTFLSAYTGNREEANEAAIEASSIGGSLLRFMEGKPCWKGACSDLLTALEADAHSDERTRKQNTWPKNGRAMRSALDRIAPNLRALGINVRHLQRTGRVRPVELARTSDRPSQPSPSSSTDQDCDETTGCPVSNVTDETNDVTVDSGSADADRHIQNRDSARLPGIGDGRDGSDGPDGHDSVMRINDPGGPEREIIEV